MNKTDVIVSSIIALVIVLFGSGFMGLMYYSQEQSDKHKPFSNVTCNLNGYIRYYNHVKVYSDMQFWAHGLYFKYKGKDVSVQDTYCIVEEE